MQTPQASGPEPGEAPKRRPGRPPKVRREGEPLPPAIAIAFERDMCTCTYAEMQERWANARDAAQKVGAIELATGTRWSTLVPETHNPLYYLAKNYFFDNARAQSNLFLYAPLHRDKLCKPLVAYVLDGATDLDGFLYLGSRDTYKSTFAGALAMWFLLRKKHLEGYDARVVLRHHKELLASKNLLRVKAKFQFHKRTRRFWNEYCPQIDPRTGAVPRDWGTKTEFTLPNASMSGEQAEASLRAIGMTSSDAGFHSDLDIGDDLVTEDHVNSKVIRDAAKAKYEAKQFTRDTVEGKEADFGTPYHLNDLWGSLIKANTEGEASYKVVIVPAKEDYCPREGCGHDEHAHVRVLDGEVKPQELLACTKCSCLENQMYNHPYRITEKFLAKRRQSEINRTGRDMMWWLQYQCRARMSGLVVADKTWIKYVDVSDLNSKAWRVILVDSAWKGMKNAGEGCAASIQVWAIERRGSLLLRTLIDGVHSRELTSLAGMNEIFRLIKKHGVSDVGIEEYGGYAFRTAFDAEATTRGVFVNQIEFASKQVNKNTRMATFMKEMQTGRVFVVKSCDPALLEAYVDQVLDFPQTNPNDDDALDCAAYVMDPAVQESYAPTFNTLAAGDQFVYQETRRTRHCAA